MEADLYTLSGIRPAKAILRATQRGRANAVRTELAGAQSISALADAVPTDAASAEPPAPRAIAGHSFDPQTLDVIERAARGGDRPASWAGAANQSACAYRGAAEIHDAEGSIVEKTI